MCKVCRLWNCRRTLQAQLQTHQQAQWQTQLHLHVSGHHMQQHGVHICRVNSWINVWYLTLPPQQTSCSNATSAVVTFKQAAPVPALGEPLVLLGARLRPRVQLSLPLRAT